MDPGNAFYQSVQNHLDANGNYTGWTPSLSDNVSAKLDFSELTNVTDASNLYNKLSELVGVELAFPCGTCYEFEAIRFGGKFEGIDNVIFMDKYYYKAKTEIDLSAKSFRWDNKEYAGYFNAITDVINMDDSDPDKAQKTIQLASAIAADLAQTTFDVLNNAMTKHYDRAIRDASDPYSVYVYDYRDTDSISPGNSVDSNVIMTYSQVRMQYEEVVEGGYYTHFNNWNSDQIWIQASDEVGDGIPILSKYLSAEFFKLNNYRVDTFTSEMTWEDYNAYQKRLSAWEAKVPEPTTEWYKQKVTVVTGITPGEYREYYENGEPKREMIKPPVVQTQEEEREFPRLVWDESKAGPRPVRGCSIHEVYAPSELSLIDDALAMVSSVRSYYGAVQNRLEHTYKNNANAHENITYAESRIRDTDMAEELVKNSMLNILKQAGFSMLSQANQLNQGVSMLLS
ncbi:MAG: flagellin [Lachnospiraceae bacterium]|nr:flagellin [Lachnospiraceae bacterium]